ncbi:MAG: Ig-like domain-containing protein [Saccharofermentans sp.]|nr:Ig-like domain-containing protein [Saccharofermentans sp.]
MILINLYLVMEVTNYMGMNRKCRAVFCVLFTMVILLTACSRVESVSITDSKLDLKVKETYMLDYSVEPEEADNKKTEWTSSDESVATVDSHGKVTAVDAGTCTITLTIGDKNDTVTVNVTAGPDFQAIYDEYCDYSWAKVGSDNSYLSIDTNPYNLDDYLEMDALTAIRNVNDALDLPESAYDGMSKVRALDGRVNQTYGDISVSYQYHPNQGLEVTYTYNGY